MKKILITGGAGFIGYHLGKYLADKGEEVTLVDNFFRGKKDEDLEQLLKLPNIKFIEVDLTRPESWEKLGLGYDYVYHLAAVNGTELFYEIPHEVLRINLLTTIYALEWFRRNHKGGSKILFTSSNEAYAGAREAFGILPYPTPEYVPLVIPDVYNPRWSYAGTKLIGEQLFIHYAQKCGFRMSIVRPHNFYGPRAGFKHVIPELILRIKNRTDPFPVYGYYDKRSFCYIEDAIKAMAMVAESDKTDGHIYHIGSHEERKIMNLVDTLFRLMDWKPKDLIINDSPAGSVKRRVPDVSKIKNDVGWQAVTSLEEGLHKTYEWYKVHPKKQ